MAEEIASSVAVPLSDTTDASPALPPSERLTAIVVKEEPPLRSARAARHRAADSALRPDDLPGAWFRRLCPADGRRAAAAGLRAPQPRWRDVSLQQYRDEASGGKGVSHHWTRLRFSASVVIVAAMLAALAVKLFWCGSDLQVVVGFALVAAFAAAISGTCPYVFQVLVLATQIIPAGFGGLYALRTLPDQAAAQPGRGRPRGPRRTMAQRRLAAGRLCRLRHVVHPGQSRSAEGLRRDRAAVFQGGPRLADAVRAHAAGSLDLDRRAVGFGRAAPPDHRPHRRRRGIGRRAARRRSGRAGPVVPGLAEHAGGGDRAVRRLPGLRVQDALVPRVSARASTTPATPTKGPPG